MVSSSVDRVKSLKPTLGSLTKTDPGAPKKISEKGSVTASFKHTFFRDSQQGLQNLERDETEFLNRMIIVFSRFAPELVENEVIRENLKSDLKK